jgi:hypothetical protein
MAVVTDCIVTIQDLLDKWRELGHEKLPNGTELIGRFPDEETPTWTHVVFPGLSPRRIGMLEAKIGGLLPSRLNAFYRLIGGMTLFVGAFRMAGARTPGIRCGIDSLCPDDIVELNHELDVLGWKPRGAVAFATNSWDGSVHLAGMGQAPDEIVRCERVSGRILECHENVFTCVSSRLTRLDEILLA